jgi:hypothetical protein
MVSGLFFTTAGRIISGAMGIEAVGGGVFVCFSRSFWARRAAAFCLSITEGQLLWITTHTIARIAKIRIGRATAMGVLGFVIDEVEDKSSVEGAEGGGEDRIKLADPEKISRVEITRRGFKAK